MQEGRHAKGHFVSRFEPIAAFEQISSAPCVFGSMTLPGDECQRRSAFRPLLPKRLDLIVRFLEIRNGGAPKAEFRSDLRGCPFVPRRFENFPHRGWQRVGGHIGADGDAEAEAAQIMVLIIIGIPTAMLLRQPKIELDAIGKRERFLRNENVLAGLITPARPRVDAPGGVILAVNRE